MRKSTNTHSIRFYLVGFLQNDHIRIQCAAKDFPPTKTVVRTLITRKLFNPNFLNKHFFLWTTRRIISVVDAGLMKIGINFRNEKRYNFICLQFVHLHRVESSEYQMQIFILFSNEKKSTNNLAPCGKSFWNWASELLSYIFAIFLAPPTVLFLFYHANT